MLYRIKLVGILAALAALGGCGGETLPTVPVTGTVTYNGKPLDGADISFIPKDPTGEARGASGATDAHGNFKLQTFLVGSKMVAGALPGDYAVTVSKREDFTAKLRESMAGGGPADGRKLMEEGAQAPSAPAGPPGGGPPGRPRAGGPPMGMPGTMIGKLLVPEKYTSPGSSELTATVKPSGNDPFQFELTD